MYGAVIGDLVGFPYEYKHVDLRNQAIPLFPEKYAGSGDSSARAGDGFSDKTVMAVGMEAGLLNFERKLPEIFAGKTEGNSSEGTEGVKEIAVVWPGASPGRISDGSEYLALSGRFFPFEIG